MKTGTNSTEAISLTPISFKLEKIKALISIGVKYLL